LKETIRIVVLVSAAAGCLFADASYSETVQYQGGTLVEMLRGMANGPMAKMMGGRIGQAFQDQTYTIYLKGNKMARIGNLNSIITDLDAGTITNIDNMKKTYNVTTFEEMKQTAAEMQKRMKTGDTKLDFDVKVDKTGNTKTIEGQLATEYVMTLTAKDAGAGKEAGAGMKVVSHVWLVPTEPGSSEIRAYYTKIASQYKDAIGAAGGPMMAGASRGMAAASAQLANLDGVSVENHMEVSGIASPMGPMAPQGGDPNAPALIMATQNKAYSKAPVDDSKFAVPEGYQKVDRQMRPRRGRPQQDPQ
jgi:hypothetical protein